MRKPTWKEKIENPGDYLKMKNSNPKKSSVIMRKTGSGMSIILNRQEALNSLTLEMVRLITGYFNEALADDECKLILFYGLGDKGFCAGGDIRRIAADMRNNNLTDVNNFFREEFSLDLMIHRSPKPVIVIADGITMGGGLGIAAGADLVIATEKTRMAMPETRIGFFPMWAQPDGCTASVHPAIRNIWLSPVMN
jgi:enoyl-CoA hydratase/carnithine racemase